LTVVGTGIKFMNHLTTETKTVIENAETVLFAVAERYTYRWIKKANESARSFPGYTKDRPRRELYESWIEIILEHVRAGEQVCAVFYGHPGAYVSSGHKAVRRARDEGFEAEMLPGISAEACLFADMQVDPCQFGYHSFEASDFLIRKRPFDIHGTLVLLQIGLVGLTGYDEGRVQTRGLKVLREYLETFYGPEHEVTVYEAAHLAVSRPQIEKTRLGDLESASVSPLSTLYVPPLSERPRDSDMLALLDLAP
jgi:precorrin-6B methylase 1